MAGLDTRVRGAACPLARYDEGLPSVECCKRRQRLLLFGRFHVSYSRVLVQ